jgi:hypothetical protein
VNPASPHERQCNQPSPQENEIRIPARFAPIVFGAMLSAIMVAIVSAFVLATARGLDPGFTAQCGDECFGYRS